MDTNVYISIKVELIITKIYIKKFKKVKNITSLSIWILKSVDIKDIYSFSYL